MTTRRRTRSPRSLALLVVALLTATCLGAGLALLALRPPTPPTLAATTSTDMRVEQRSLADTRSLPVTLERGSERTLTLPTSGRITTLDITPGATLTSGSRVATIDDRPLIALATPRPLWRELSDGMRGPDVTALQGELRRLGENAPDSGVVDWNTRRAAAHLAGIDDGRGGIPGTIPVDIWLWIPAPKITVRSVATDVGRDVTAGADLLTLASGLTGARITPPTDALPGARTITFLEKTFPVEADGAITDPEALTALAAHPLVVQRLSTATGEELKVQVEWSLAEPLRAWSLPPAAIVTAGTDRACVVVDGRSVPVRILASELGRTFVQPEGEAGPSGHEGAQSGPGGTLAQSGASHDASVDLTRVSLDVEGASCP